MKALRPADQPRVDALMKVKAVVAEGYGGVLGNGNIVDRREHPTAIPIPKNSLLGVPEPKAIT